MLTPLPKPSAPRHHRLEWGIDHRTVGDHDIVAALSERDPPQRLPEAAFGSVAAHGGTRRTTRNKRDPRKTRLAGGCEDREATDATPVPIRRTFPMSEFLRSDL